VGSLLRGTALCQAGDYHRLDLGGCDETQALRTSLKLRPS